MERRRCNHHTLDEPLSTLDCLRSVIDPKTSLANKNRYVVASQDEAVRRFCRGVKGVPLVFERRSVMIMEPMAESSVGAREGLEKSKFRSGLRARGTGLLGKRKRGDQAIDLDEDREEEGKGVAEVEQDPVKQRKVRGPKGPNPLAVKKSKKATAAVQKAGSDDQKPGDLANRPQDEAGMERPESEADVVDQTPDEGQNPPSKRKRKRKPKLRQNEMLVATINSDNEAGE